MASFAFALGEASSSAKCGDPVTDECYYCETQRDNIR